MSPAARLKLLTILVVVVGAALGLAASTQNWYSFHLTPAADHPVDVTLAGSSAAPALTALSLAALALALAFAIGGRIARIVLGVLGIAVAACIFAETVTTMAHPESAGISAITSATGVAGNSSVLALIARTEATIWPALALLGAIIVALGSLAAIVLGQRWPVASRRYEAVRWEDDDPSNPSGFGSSDNTGFATQLDDSDDGGGDTGDGSRQPSDFAPARAASAGTNTPDTQGTQNTHDAHERAPETPTTRQPHRRGTPAARSRHDAVSDWDELSRGEDPTTR